MNRLWKAFQIGCTYIGTIVGAGFATGQEILTFFTKFGRFGTVAIAIAALLFIWIGTKTMLLAHERQSVSYEDLNRHLFGDRIGSLFSLLMLVVLFCTTSVMLAGAGSLFYEQFGFPYQAGLLITAALVLVVLTRGMQAILAVNAIVVPLMAVFSVTLVWFNAASPTSVNWISLGTDESLLRTLASPLLYVAFNLTLAQAVLVPVGAQIEDRRAIVWGGWFGGLGVGAMLLAGHFVLAANMPGIAEYEIPMGGLVGPLGRVIGLIFLFVIFFEIFTTLIADVYGLSLQLGQHVRLKGIPLLIVILLCCYAMSQIGFSTLLSFLYPIFGMLGLGWLVLMMVKAEQHHESGK